ncbi:MAG TPA: polymer-forming cytoskeletal protein [Leptospiraceae bacterium]|nr:polymer-forming cytoskeletal protein [Leptospirales bacterium]HMU84198.1 polymer-forming cytoskeletal protein [Leptospiraceae bacterium]HMX58846.1 polymer-forming cytoskeletal protein [Leptospiraceae bacterium]HMY45588.1 polymer-forming cytoskeletal protein [Leptospiraceae bacterium]HNE24654.1 polymer-forming cytoskeletal protein [Leptospiraceae bacterium]
MQDIDTVLGDDIQFRGRLQFKRNLKINGAFRGKIQTGGQLIVGSGAKVEADVEASHITVEGELRGNLQASKSLEIKRNAQVSGDIRTPDLHVESGSRFTGSCIMD